MPKDYKAVLISMSGVRVYNKNLLELGLTLPGFVERSQVIASLPSLGLLTLAAHSPANWEIIYQELDVVCDDDVQKIINLHPDIVAFSSLTARINEAYKLAKVFRASGITVVIGGLHASAIPMEAILHADTVIQGEGELAWPDLLKDYERGNCKKLYSSLTRPAYSFNFSLSKVPRYNLLDISKYNRLTIQTTRGCPLNCNFCAASRTISRYKKKPIEQVRKELDAIFEVWNRPFIELADDNTFIDKTWSKELLKLFGRYKMKWFTETDISVAYDDELLELLAASNCAQVLIGFEASQAATLLGVDRNNWKHRQFDNYLKAIDKIQSYGISVNGCFILGFDTDTEQTFYETEKFIKGSNLSEVQVTLLTPFPGTDLYRKLKHENRLLTDNYWDKCTLFDVNFMPKNFSVQQLENHFASLMASVYADDAVKTRKLKFKQTLKNKLNQYPHEHL
ncbi:B12-binding domain-containing radical SAM protein [Foetidibacter luteolus]|uniref:B12-binding domain-containing radical SAM protein n=1 Tax=Foetidibacter luteolus TaxID=2608880 RepID=UPI00129B87A7|nr:radical SAM protein [Foetidibacter luteolus]